jgi:hypothetical protein
MNEYLQALARALPRGRLSRRFLDEVEGHLRESAEAHGSEAEAVARFGTVDEVAARLRGEIAQRASLVAGRVVLVATLVYALPFYVLPENAFPPALWLEMPSELAWKHEAAIVAFVVAVVSAVAGIALGRRARLVALTLAVASLAASLVISAIMDAQWAEYVPNTPTGLVWGAILPAKLALAAAGAWSLAWALRLSRSPSPHP